MSSESPKSGALSPSFLSPSSAESTATQTQETQSVVSFSSTNYQQTPIPQNPFEETQNPQNPDNKTPIQQTPNQETLQNPVEEYPISEIPLQENPIYPVFIPDELVRDDLDAMLGKKWEMDGFTTEEDEEKEAKNQDFDFTGRENVDFDATSEDNEAKNNEEEEELTFPEDMNFDAVFGRDDAKNDDLDLMCPENEAQILKMRESDNIRRREEDVCILFKESISEEDDDFKTLRCLKNFVRRGKYRVPKFEKDFLALYGWFSMQKTCFGYEIMKNKLEKLKNKYLMLIETYQFGKTKLSWSSYNINLYELGTDIWGSMMLEETFKQRENQGIGVTDQKNETKNQDFGSMFQKNETTITEDGRSANKRFGIKCQENPIIPTSNRISASSGPTLADADVGLKKESAVTGKLELFGFDEETLKKHNAELDAMYARNREMKMTKFLPRRLGF